jgi:Secretion system C-terminal sorting domain
MKKTYVIYAAMAALFLVLIMQYQPAVSNSTGAPSNVTGSPSNGGNTCAQGGCHSSFAAKVVPGMITSTIPAAGYTPGMGYTISMTVSSANDSVFGFEISPQNNAGTPVGTMSYSLPIQTATAGYLTHTNPIGIINHVRTLSFNWTAPAAGTGNVTFYGAFNMANNDGTSAGDSIYTSTLAVNEVLAVAHVAVSITSGANPGCLGDPITFTATPTNGGSSPSYQWQVNGANVGTASTYTSSLLVNNDVVRCIMTSSISPVGNSPDTSAPITMILGPKGVLDTVTITASSLGICVGASDTFTATPINGGSSPTYQWYLNGVLQSSHGAQFITNVLQNNDSVSCTMTSNQGCLSSVVAFSNVLHIATGISVTPTIKITQNGSTHSPPCQGDNMHFDATITNGGTSPVYQWRINGHAVGTNVNSFDTTTLTTGDLVTCDLRSNSACVSAAVVGSNVAAPTLAPVVVPNISIAPDLLKVCSGDRVTLTATTSNGGSSPSYVWLLNGNTVALSGTTYAFIAVVSGLSVRCVFTSSAVCALPAVDTSNLYITSLNTGPASMITPSGTITICGNDSVKLTASGGLHYSWSNGDTSTTVWADKNTGIIGLIARDSSGCSGTFVLDTILVGGTPPAPTVTNHYDTLFASNIVAGTWAWYRNDTLIPGATSATYHAVKDGNYKALFTSTTGCKSVSASLNITHVGIDEISASQLHIYPNPSTGIFSLEREHSGEGELQVYSIYGQLVHSQHLQQLYETIDVSALSAGMYYAVVAEQGTTRVARIELR